MRLKRLLLIVFMVSIIIVCQAVAQQLGGLTEEQLEIKVETLERRIVRLELIIATFRNFSVQLADPQFELELENMVSQVMEEEPKKTNILGSVILIGSLILLVVGIAVLTIRLSRR